MAGFKNGSLVLKNNSNSLTSGITGHLLITCINDRLSVVDFSKISTIVLSSELASISSNLQNQITTLSSAPVYWSNIEDVPTTFNPDLHADWHSENGVDPLLITTNQVSGLGPFASIKLKSDNTTVGSPYSLYITGNLTSNYRIICDIAADSGGGHVYNNTAGTRRWQWFPGTVEGSGNTGYDLFLGRYDNAGTYLGNACFIRRNSGVFNFSSRPIASGTTVSVTSDLLSYLPLTGGNLSNSLNISGNVTSSYRNILNIDPDGGGGHVYNNTAGTRRWQWFPGTVEGSGNTGYDLFLGRYDNAGTYLGYSLKINRNTGVFDFNTRPIANGTTVSITSDFNNYLSKTTGGNVTGSIKVSYRFTSNSVPGSGGGYAFENGNSIRRWQSYLGGEEISGTNIGADLYVGRYDANGVFISNALKIDSETGTVTVGDGLTVGSALVTGAALKVNGSVKCGQISGAMMAPSISASLSDVITFLRTVFA